MKRFTWNTVTHFIGLNREVNLQAYHDTIPILEREDAIQKLILDLKQLSIQMILDSEMDAVHGGSIFGWIVTSKRNTHCMTCCFSFSERLYQLIPMVKTKLILSLKSNIYAQAV